MNLSNHPSNKYITRLCALILPLATLMLGSSTASGATKIYSGDGNNGKFSDSNNWQNGKPGPVNYDNLVFGDGTLPAIHTTARNNQDVFFVNSISFVDPTSALSFPQSFNIKGSAILLGTGKTDAAGVQHVIIDSSGSTMDQTVSLNLVLVPDTTALQHIVTGNASLTINSKITLGGTSLGFEGPGLISMQGRIKGAGSDSRAASLVIGDFSTSTSGNVFLNGNNVNLAPNSSGYSVNLQDGSLEIGNDHALGSGNLLINGTNNNVLSTNAGHTIKNGITANISFKVLPVGNLKIDGAVNLVPVDGATSLVITNGSTSFLNSGVQFNGGITGGGVGDSIVLQGVGDSLDPSHFTISGTTASSYTGALIVDNDAVLELNVKPAHSAITGDLSVTQGSTVTLDRSHQLSTTTNLNVDGTFAMNGHHEKIDSLTGAGTVTIGSGGRLTLNSGSFGSLNVTALTDGTSGAGGEVVKDGPGTFTLNGNSDYSGRTTINGGTFAAGASFVLDADSHYEVNSGGTLAIMGHSNSIGSLGGKGVVENGGASIAGLTIGNDNQSFIFHGTLEDGDGGGALSLTKIGNGALYLKGNNTYSGGTEIDNGQLIVGTPTALGTGDVAVTGFGMLSSGHIGTPRNINVGGSYAQFGGYLSLNVFANGTNDQLVVSGNSVSIHQAATLDLFSLSTIGPVSTATSYDLIHNSAGGITGTFGTVNGLSDFSIPTGLFGTLDYSPTDVTLLFRQYLGLTQGLTPNQQSIANFLDRLESVNTAGSYGKVVDGLYNGGSQGLGGNLDQLSSQQFAQFASATAFNNAVFETQAMDNYLNGLRSGPNGTFVGGNGKIDSTGLTVNDPNYDSALETIHSRLLAWSPTPQSGLLSDSGDAVLGGVDMKDSKDVKSMASAPGYTNPWNLFVRGNIILAQGSSQQDTGYFSDNSESVVIGTDYRICPNFLVGVTLGYAHTDATLDNAGSSATVDSYSPGVYAAWADKGWYANFNGAYTYNSYSDTRNISFLGQSSTGNTRGNQGSVNLDGGYDFHSGCMTFGPLVGLQYTHLTVKGYDESGSDASLNVDRDQSDSLRSRLGGRVSWNTKMGGIGLNPHLDASWQHEFMDQSRGITSQFNTFGGGSFVVQTVNPSRESALLDAGINIDVTDTITVFTDYMAQVGQDNYFGQSVQAGAKFGF